MIGAEFVYHGNWYRVLADEGAFVRVVLVAGPVFDMGDAEAPESHFGRSMARSLIDALAE
jgi:hypothetical protein